MRTRREERILLVVLSLCFLGLSFAYQLATPLGEAPDELSHFRVITYLVRHRTWPVVGGPGADVPHESTQFPLYYVLAAIAMGWIRLDEQIVWEELNPHHVGAPAPPPEAWANRNLIVHDPREIWNWKGEILAFRIARLISSLTGLTAILLVYRLIRRVLPRRPAAAMIGVALMAFHPRWIALASSVSNDALAVAGAALALNAIVDYVLGPSWKRAGWSGLAMGAALMAKASNIGLIPLWLLVWMASARSRPSWRARGGELALSLLGVALISGGWLGWNYLLYQDPLAFRAHLSMIHWHRPQPPSGSDWIAIALRARETAFLSFGATEGIIAEQWIYGIWDLFLLLTGVQALRRVWRFHFSRLPDRSRALPPLIPALWLGIVILEFISWNLRVEAPTGRLLFIALPAFWWVVVWAWEGSPSTAWERGVLRAWLVFTMTLSVLGFSRYLWPAFHQPLRTREEIPADLERLDWVFEDLEGPPGEPLVRLIGFRATPRRLKPGQAVQLIACWELLRPASRNYSFTYQIWSGPDPARGERLGQVDSYPGMGSWPMRFWPSGRVICDIHRVPLAMPRDAPTLLSLLVGVYDRSRADLRPLPRRGGDGWIPFAKIPPSSPMSEHGSWDARFEPGILLLAHHVQVLDQGIRVRLTWKATAPLPSDLHVFLHLLDAEGRWLAGGDGPPRGGAYPTGWWEPGEVVEEERWIEWKHPLPPGVYSVHTGWYHLKTGERLPVVDPTGRPFPGFSVPLEELRIHPVP
ncbi:ArnT family glycosyltransferase [Thermoflexus sp.]|uniref:ArnT family glycosyltransferase n=1 Tax=Thermoflexus sp. TaxID=1969742 RepID=UPI002ADD6B56|nr:glycosyltransferase family 39 protein [Thermoflexus sp.]